MACEIVKSKRFSLPLLCRGREKNLLDYLWTSCVFFDKFTGEGWQTRKLLRFCPFATAFLTGLQQSCGVSKEDRLGTEGTKIKIILCRSPLRESIPLSTFSRPILFIRIIHPSATFHSKSPFCDYSLGLTTISRPQNGQNSNESIIGLTS